jgi:hypothetical protein
VLKTIPVSCEERDLLEFTFGPEPVITFIAWEAVPLKIDFICAAPDFVVTWCVVCRSILDVRPNRVCVVLQRPTSLAHQWHTRVLSYLNCSRSSGPLTPPRHESRRKVVTRGHNDGIARSETNDNTSGGSGVCVVAPRV